MRTFLTFHAILLLSTLTVPSFSVADSPPHKTVNITGTFNDWNEADTNTVMSYTDNQSYRIKRFFRAGSYKFQFTVDGSWGIHYGAGEGERLAQPGKDIELNIPRHGAYVIDLDLAKRRWWLVPTAVDSPKPVVIIRGVVEANLPIVLDASGSVAREGAKIGRYDFAQDTNDAVQVKLDRPSADAPQATVRLPQPGTYRFWVKVNDGTESAAEAIVLKPQTSYQVLSAWTGTDPQQPVTFLRRQSPHLFDKILRPSQPEGQKLKLVRNHDASQVVKTLTLNLGMRGFWHLRFNEKSGQFICSSEDFVEVTYRHGDNPNLTLRNVTVHSVSIAGSFNGWNASATPLTDAGDGTYVAYLKLDDGLHIYKFVVNGTIWLQDPKADPSLRVDDGHGGFNSGIFIGERGQQFGPQPTNDINFTAVKHRTDDARFFNVVSSDFVELKLRMLHKDATQVSVHLVEKQSFPWSLFMSDREKIVPMQVVKTEYGFDTWLANVFLDKPEKKVSYYFTLVDGPTVRTLGSYKDKGGSKNLITAEVVPLFPTPDWAKNAVWYQIMVDRFRNGTTANDPTNAVPWRWDWYKCTAWESPVEGKQFSSDWYGRRFGGDLQGLIEKLPYFRELGVNAIYLCPVFQANSYHGYDTTDYRHVDSFYGFRGDNTNVIAQETLDSKTWQWTPSDKLFLEFIQKAHAQGLKVIVDGVFNHMGKSSFALQNTLAQGTNSPYADWFDVTDWGPPIKYRSWDGGGWMPNFRKDTDHGIASDSARQYLFDITRRWMDPNSDGDPSDGIDGWRLDVAADVPRAFWVEWRKVVKSVNPNAYITGEEWGPAPKHLQGDEWDAVMNYQFAIRAVRYFIDQKRKISPTEFDRQLKELLAIYPMQVNMAMQNLYDSHDTDRLANMIINPDRDYDQCNRPQDGCPYDGSRPGPDAFRVLKLMTTFQMTFLGSPMIWYGNEVGQWGSDDPNDRKPMFWKDLEPYDDPQEKVNDDLLEHYKRLIAIRNARPALRTGLFQTLLTDNSKDLYGFTRTRGDEVVVVVLNNSSKEQHADLTAPFPNDARVVDLMAAIPGELKVRDGKLRINLPPKSAAILVKP